MNTLYIIQPHSQYPSDLLHVLHQRVFLPSCCYTDINHIIFNKLFERKLPYDHVFRWVVRSVFHEYDFHAHMGTLDLISNSIFLKNAYASINHWKSRCHFRFFQKNAWCRLQGSKNSQNIMTQKYVHILNTHSLDK